jgi:hypothetical protein
MFEIPADVGGECSNTAATLQKGAREAPTLRIKDLLRNQRCYVIPSRVKVCNMGLG